MRNELHMITEDGNVRITKWTSYFKGMKTVSYDVEQKDNEALVLDVWNKVETFYTLREANKKVLELLKNR